MPEDKVLIVDDEPTMRVTLGEALGGWGYRVAEAGSGRQALAALAAERPAVVLLDINLPDSSGLDLLREIKRRRPQAAVIMLTAETVFDNAVSALRGGADDFVGKPVNLDELRFTLGRVMGARRGGQEPVAAGKARVLVVSDSPARLPHLQAAFRPHEVEMTSVVYPEEWGRAAGKHDLALIDVGPEKLEPLLRAVRADQAHAEIPVLVEIGSAVGAANPPGLMPKYRAMPCGRDEMVQLARRRVMSFAGREQARGLL
jgi:DNA-binding response OmpR family regulator